MPQPHQDGFLSSEPYAASTSPHDPIDAVRAVAEPREEREQETGTGTATTTTPDKGTEYGEFSWPDGYIADPAAVAKFIPLARELGLPKQSAQQLAHLYAELDLERHQTQARFIEKNDAEWLREIQNHPEFGGNSLDKTGADVATMLRRYGSPLLTAQIRQMNIQNWPEMFYFLARLSQTVTEDCSPSGTAASASTQSAAQILFPGLK